MSNFKKVLDILRENEDSKYLKAIGKINKLPDNTKFEGVKLLTGEFKMYKRIHNEVLVDYENHEIEAEEKLISIKNIFITQPSVSLNKIKKFIQRFTNINSLPPVIAVKYGNDIVLVDGHHRLASIWALGEKNIKASLVEIK